MCLSKNKDKYEENVVLKAFYLCSSKIKNINLPWGVMSGIRPAKVVRQYREEGYSDDEIKNIL